MIQCHWLNCHSLQKRTIEKLKDKLDRETEKFNKQRLDRETEVSKSLHLVVACLNLCLLIQAGLGVLYVLRHASSLEFLSPKTALRSFPQQFLFDYWEWTTPSQSYIQAEPIEGKLVKFKLQRNQSDISNVCYWLVPTDESVKRWSSSDDWAVQRNESGACSTTAANDFFAGETNIQNWNR